MKWLCPPNATVLTVATNMTIPVGRFQKKKCSHILRLNISSLLRKIDEIRFVGISESKLDSSVINNET